MSLFSNSSTPAYEEAAASGEPLGVPSEPVLPSSHNTPDSAQNHALGDNARIKREPTSSGPTEVASAVQHTFPNLQEVVTSNSVEDLERGTKVGITVLNGIIQRLNHAKDCRDASYWLQSMKDFLPQAKRPQYIIGVVGSTGHGKSSLINALLQETQMVPTNCVRACTAVITEISWNPSDNPEERYIGNVEFISKEEWRYELDHLFLDLMQSNGALTADATNKATDAGVAWAKIKAVYPNITKEALAETDADSLANDVATFYKDIQVYVDSKQKFSFSESKDATPDKYDKLGADSIQDDSYDDSVCGDEAQREDAEHDRASYTEKRKMELWPLIKVVRVQTKADVLSTGAVIVDLPGVEDSNAARAAIAGKYIEKCHGIWIVANIQRAVDDRSAQNLLSQSFKQQLQLDGNFSNITFICTKTDDICFDEATRSLGLHNEQRHLRSKQKALERWEASNRTRLYREELHSSILLEFLGEIDRILAQWEKLESRQKGGATVHMPRIEPRKRKNTERNAGSRKRQKSDSHRGEQDRQAPPSVDELLDKLKTDGPSMAADQPLDGEQIRSTIEYLRSKKSVVLDEKEVLDNRMGDDDCIHAGLSDAVSREERKYAASCIRKRNEYARNAIRQDFALGLKELDDEFSQQANPESFDPEDEQRDYRSLAAGLPVFCISSRAYQSLPNLSDNQNPMLGFESSEATEIPQLIEHAKRLTESRRTQAYGQFLSSFLQGMNSLYIWVSQDEGEVQLTDEEKQAQVENVKAALTLQQPKQLAKHQVLPPGGLHIAKATGVWGVFSGKSGPRDFNEDLIRPLKKKLGNSWEQAFTKKIPKAFEEFTRASEELLQTFHRAIKAQLQQKSTFTSINVLQAQLESRADGLTHMARSFNDDVTMLQREANRSFHPAVMDAMSGTYEDCAGDGGPGCFLRIKNRMDRDLRDNGHLIFKAAAEPVKRGLQSLCDHLKTELKAKTAKILDSLATDYSNVIVGRDITRESKVAREEVSLLLKGLDDMVEHALQVSPEIPGPGPSAVDMTVIKREEAEQDTGYLS
ncbi:hypothetical protein DL764_006036 [Monosporascus ibericus]|uniref:G domain-containing protein n=1 Tax=Monosporascus ibericus TaxID=155417 RepID=A0A4V1XA87_9PEZI|nr:hypothetical protein DL764_006036 [Monosporascus ibericus]